MISYNWSLPASWKALAGEVTFIWLLERHLHQSGTLIDIPCLMFVLNPMIRLLNDMAVCKDISWRSKHCDTVSRAFMRLLLLRLVFFRCTRPLWSSDQIGLNRQVSKKRAHKVQKFWPQSYRDRTGDQQVRLLIFWLEPALVKSASPWMFRSF